MKNPIILNILLNQQGRDLTYINETFKYGQVKAKDIKFLIPEKNCLIMIIFYRLGPGKLQTLFFTKLHNGEQIRIDNFDKEYEKIENHYVKKLGVVEGFFIITLY